VIVLIAAAELEMKYPALSQSLGGRRIFWAVAPVRRLDKLVKAVRQLDDKVTYDGGYGGLDVCAQRAMFAGRCELFALRKIWGRRKY